MPVSLYPHQQKAVNELSSGKILYGDVGTGKTITSLMYYLTKECGGTPGDYGSMQTPMDLVVITTAKKRDSLDWEMDAMKLGFSRNDRSASMGNIDMSVDSWNNIAKYEDRTGCFFILDEQRLVGTGAWVKSFKKIAKANRWILLSGTPGDVWLDYAPVFIANGYFKNITEFKREHVVYSYGAKFPKIERYIGEGKLMRLRSEVLVHMPYDRHTKRVRTDVEVAYDRELFEKVVKKRWHVYEERPIRDVAEMFSLMRKVVNRDPSRIRAVQQLMAKHPKLILFYNFDYELEGLREMALEEVQRSSLSRTAIESLQSSATSTVPSTGSETTSKHQTSSLITTLSGPTTSTSKRSSDFSESRSTPYNVGGSIMSTVGEPGEPCQDGTDQPSFAVAEANEWNPTTTGSTFDHSAEVKSRTSSTSSSRTGSGLASVPTSDTEKFQFAEWNGHKHQEIPKTDRWLYLVQYQAGAEGWNCIETDAMAFYSLTYSYRNFHQAHGRTDRLNTPYTTLQYYVLKSKSLIDIGIWRALTSKKNFNERSFAKEIAA